MIFHLCIVKVSVAQVRGMVSLGGDLKCLCAVSGLKALRTVLYVIGSRTMNESKSTV